MSFGADFLETWDSRVERARQYALFRAPRKSSGNLTIGRATYVGPRLSMTASKCDDWIPTAAGAEAEIPWSVLNIVIANRPPTKTQDFDIATPKTALANHDPAGARARTGVPAATLTELAAAD